jgi:hypothetical protein
MEKLTHDIHELQQTHQNSTINVRAEIILTELIRNGIRIENLLFQLTGTLNRAHRKDILEFKYNPSQHDKVDVFVCREGLYDYLPKSMFFPLHDTSRRGNSVEMTANYRVNNKIEEDARKFFSPLDTIFSLYRVEAEQEARSLNEASGVGNQGPLGIIWDLPEELNSKERNLLILMLPFTRQIVANSSLLSGLYSLFFNTPFKVNTPVIIESKDYCDTIPLGECHLGFSSLLDGNLINEHLVVLLEFEISSQQDLIKFQPGSRFDMLLNLLNNIFLPLECLYLKQPILKQILPQLSLGEDAHYVLDYSAYLAD